MRVGVIRGDLPSPIFLADLEPTSQTNFPVDPPGQSTYLEYPNPTVLTNYLGGLNSNGVFESGGVPAGIQGTAAVTFPVTLTGSNNVLSIQLVSAGPFTAVTIPVGTYPTMASLLAAVNGSCFDGGFPLVAASAATDATGTFFVLQSKAVGVGAYIGVNTNGVSTFNTVANFTASQNFTMPSASTIITALNPPGGPLNVSPAAILTNLGAAPAAAGAANVIAPQFVETEVAIRSYQVGNIAQYLSPNFNPNPSLVPALPMGPAISVVEDDGVTLFSASPLAPLPTITSATHSAPNAGDLTIAGAGLGNSEYYNSTVVRVTNPVTGVFVHLDQRLIAYTVSGGTTGSVSATSIVIPASLLNGLGVAGSLVEVKFGSLPSSVYGAAASITTAVLGVSTVTGLTNMTPSSVGTFLKLAGCANPTNNGKFLVLSYISASSVTVGIPNGVQLDANSGSIQWVNSPYVVAAV